MRNNGMQSTALPSGGRRFSSGAFIDRLRDTLRAIGAMVFSRKSGEICDALLGAAAHTVPQRAEIIPD